MAQPDQGYGADAGAGGKKKRRGYAGEAYSFGQGANVAPEGTPQTQHDLQPGYGQQPQANYDQATSYGQPAFGGYNSAATQQQPAYGQPQYPQKQVAAGGYQAPDAGYPAPAQPDMGGLTQDMSKVGFGGSPNPPPQQAQSNRPHLNQLYPTDMMNQPFQVTELDLPSPPIVLPPNVSSWSFVLWYMLTDLDERYCIGKCKLSTEIHPFHIECCSDDKFTSQEI